MRKELVLLLILYLILFTLSNDKDRSNCDTTIIGKWEAKEFMSVESVLYAKNNGNHPIIEFKNGGTVDIRLDVNQCTGNFELKTNSGISISEIACTEACCDSEFSIKFTSMLSEITSYEIENDELKLNVPGWGWIVLQLVSD